VYGCENGIILSYHAGLRESIRLQTVQVTYFLVSTNYMNAFWNINISKKYVSVNKNVTECL